MTPMTPDVPAICASLTKAQKAAVLWMREDGKPRTHDKDAPREVSFWAIRNRLEGDPEQQVARTYSLCRRGDGERRKGRVWPDTTWRLTPLGLAVRAHLLKEKQP
ncbi:hypothetical protein SAQ01S_07560 [Sphingomonas aquatilis NBRC 16722]|uniref:Uncharacterized protein n=1 Tax=Sphingomonas aquatilis TaxID=93063 RepID=A0AAW3TWU5_9SPHN|nr:hypothetical protein [Sphingomonas aquatilis]MBB3876139.1 hypothetical protein [Sphingomonas aquatilis]GEM70990.1 hypothetical protein SAQ01S_07560 [Sphingomonas aquatilis NBRC 16722]